MEKKRQFENPKLQIILFANEDIIVTSTEDHYGDPSGQGGDDF